MTELDRHEVVDFLYREAELLDARRLTEWLGVLTEDIRYRVTAPTVRNLEDAGAGVREALLLDESFATLEIRVKQQSTQRHTIAENPAWFTRHFVSNVVVEPGAEADAFAAASNLLLFRSRGVELAPHLLSARRHDVVRRVDGRLRLRRRSVVLDEVVVGVRNFGGFL
ncbi:MAG: aromatic-ring-hydroxylating dioxygenase subunit beta [Kofleriaceae bacterium]